MSDQRQLPIPYSTWLDPEDARGASTSPDEAILRDIGRAAFGINYPRDVTPKRPARALLPYRTPRS